MRSLASAVLLTCGLLRQPWGMFGQTIFDCPAGGSVAVNKAGRLLVAPDGLQPAGGVVCAYYIDAGPGSMVSINFTSIDGDPGLTWAGAPPRPVCL